MEPSRNQATQDRALVLRVPNGFAKLAGVVFLLILGTMYSSRAEDLAGTALKDAKRLAAEGKYEEAPEKQVWFHNHA